MNIYDEAFTDCTFIIETKERDKYGSWKKAYKDGETFRAAIPFQNSVQDRVAQQQGVKDIYDVYTKDLTLDFHDIFRREKDGTIFRVTSNGKDNKTPDSAWLKASKVSAEIFVLPDDNE